MRRPHGKVCGKRCHAAKSKTCRCWCGGVFHGNPGLFARLEFARTFRVDGPPTTEGMFKAMTQPHLFHDAAVQWRDRVDAAAAAQHKGKA